MQIKLTGEQPFQVLSTTFTIGPSASGYDLYFSADGINYTQLFTVGAGVNRQVTQVAAGSYYKLVGNTGEVVVNWYGNCVTDNGGGGGSYVLPVASQSTLGGVKIGSGITIDSNGAISAQGGGNDNYVIVNDLSGVTTPTEGKMAYVKELATNTYNGTKIYISDFQAFTENTQGRAEDFVVRIHWGDWDSATQGEEDLLAITVYQSGANFFWDWNNNGKLNDRTVERDGVNYNIKYRAVSGDDANGSEAYFEFFPVDSTPYGDYIIQYSNYVTGETVTYEETEPGAKYTYKDEAWMKQQDSHYLNIGNTESPEATVEERIAFYNAIKKYPGDNWYMDIYNDGLRRFEYFYTSDDGKPVFTADYGGGYRKGYALNAEGGLEYCHDDSPNMPVQEFLSITSGGTITNNDILSRIAGEEPYRVWFRCDTQSSVNPDENGTAYAPLKYVYRQYEDINGETKLVYYISTEIMIGSTLYKGTWHFKEWEWGDTPTAADTWTTV